MKIKLDFSRLARFVGDVTGIAAHIQRGVTASLFRNVQPDGVASQTEVIFLIAGYRFQQLILVV